MAHLQSNCLINTNAIDSSDSQHCKRKKEYFVRKGIGNRKAKRTRLEILRLIWDFLSDCKKACAHNLVSIVQGKEHPRKGEFSFNFIYTFNFMAALTDF